MRRVEDGAELVQKGASQAFGLRHVVLDLPAPLLVRCVPRLIHDPEASEDRLAPGRGTPLSGPPCSAPHQTPLPRQPCFGGLLTQEREN
eukprot:317468-Rhodomonas_salina.1